VTAVQVRERLLASLRSDLVGPDVDEPGGAERLVETIAGAPSSRYLCGFLAPLQQRDEEKADDTAEEGIDAAVGGQEEGDADVPAARRPVFPSSIGLSALVPKSATQVEVRVTFGTYRPAGVAAGVTPVPEEREAELPARNWTRTPYERRESIRLDGARQQIDLEGSGGVTLRVELRDVPATERPLVPKGTRYCTVFLVNGRAPVPKPEADAGFVFQVKLSLRCEAGFVPRPNLRGANDGDAIDDRVGDLQYRDAYEHAVGHGVATEEVADAQGACRCVATAWVPSAEVEKVEPSAVRGVTLEMEALGAVPDGAALRAATGSMVDEYRSWIAGQEKAAAAVEPRPRREVAATLLAAARVACDRIERGIRVLEETPVALDAFRLANRAMAAQAWARSGEEMRRRGQVPTWRPFQLAFLLMNVAAQVDPSDPERDAVDLIFFPTGGGKTEAYLGLAAFVLVLRRLRNPGLASAGVTVLMRYTLRLLTLDQLERAATLISALELERRKDPERLGPQRFSIGLWVGRAATPNRFGSRADRDETTAVARVRAFAKDPSRFESPVPLEKCPWCGAPFGQDTFRLAPDDGPALQLRVLCTGLKCPFRGNPQGIPVIAVDEEIYRELPCFLVATVDKLAALPWVGKTGLLLGKNVTHVGTHGFFGPGARPPDARLLDRPLLPPDLIVQDELHLISGPLGTMVGLYETAVDALTTRQVGGKPVRAKIVASTATVRRAQAQIRAVFARDRVDVFPPPGPDRRASFFAETVPRERASPRVYVGLAAPGRSQKVLLMRAYLSLLAAAQRAFEEDPAAADPYMTLVGYFNSLRELGGSRRIVEEEVRSRLMRISKRVIAYGCVELTSRESTDRVKLAKERLGWSFVAKGKGHEPVDVALASNMISVGVDIQRLGLMVVCGQPKTAAEYIQATSRVGRDAERPGLVVTLLNLHKPRDRSHFEHFEYFHGTFYRAVEASSVTPFSPRAVDRGLVGVAVALARLGRESLTGPDAAASIAKARAELGFVGDVLARRVEAYREGREQEPPIEETQAILRQRVESLLDSWVHVAGNDPEGQGLAYQRFEEGQMSKRPLLRMPLDEDLASCDRHEARFVANRSLRDVEDSVDVMVTTLRQSARAREEAE
jgi:hypothetical protein